MKKETSLFDLQSVGFLGFEKETEDSRIQCILYLCGTRVRFSANTPNVGPSALLEDVDYGSKVSITIRITFRFSGGDTPAAGTGC